MNSADETYECLTHVAWACGVPLRTLIRELETAGYRRYSMPTQKALAEELAAPRINGGGYHWNRQRVTRFAEDRIGCERPTLPRKFLVVPIVID